MTEKLSLSWEGVATRARVAARDVCDHFHKHDLSLPLRVYGIPRGGIPATLLLQIEMEKRWAAQAFGGKPRTVPYLQMVDSVQEADFIFDDVYDSGNTLRKLRTKHHLPDIPFFTLVHKPKENLMGRWVEFPWEVAEGVAGPEENITRLLQYIGEDPEREGLMETPARVVKSFGEIYAGYKQDPAELFKSFVDGACDEMVVLRDIEFYSVCEHHMQPFFGRAHIGYIPDGKVIGVSKLARILDVYAKRLQIQERLTVQVTDALNEHLKPLGSACVIHAKHFCMICRGVEKQNSVMTTSSMTGVFRDKPEVRAEFLQFIQ